jgi:hypothetical protein
MRRMPVLCPHCHPDQVMKGGNTKVHICNTTLDSNLFVTLPLSRSDVPPRA